MGLKIARYCKKMKGSEIYFDSTTSDSRKQKEFLVCLSNIISINVLVHPVHLKGKNVRKNYGK